MSRIIVKNLPKNITEDKLRNIFGEKGFLTDVQLKYTTDGKFRQFAFIGYQNESDAEEAINYFHNTCIQTNKITVQPCALLGDIKKPISWSKYAADSSIHKKKNEKEEGKLNDRNENKKERDKAKHRTAELLQKYKDDALFQEFLEVHEVKDIKELTDIKRYNENANQDHSAPNSVVSDIKPNNESTNQDNSLSDSGVSDPESQHDEKDKKIADVEMTDLEYMKMLKQNADNKPRQKMEKKSKEKISLFTLKLRNLPFKCKKKDIKHFFKPIVPFSIRIPRNIKGIAYVGFKNEKQLKKAVIKNKSIMMGKSIQVAQYIVPGTDKQQEEVDNQKKLKWKTQEEGLKNEEDIAESGRIFIRNLSYSTTEDDIQNLFSKFGPIVEVNLPLDSVTRKLKGFGLVTFLMPEHAVRAYSELDGSVMHGRMLHLLPGIAKDTQDESLDGESTNYKKKKEKKQKAQAGLSHNWNSLFLGHDAVADIIADTLKTSKMNVLDPHGDSRAAVRLALGETEIVANTRKYLEREGVTLDAFSGPTLKRSKTIILVKNLPAKTQTKELYEIFKVHGVIGRLILPPNSVTALVEFNEPSEARKAFTRLAYSKFKNLPLYLEWAPENSLSPRKITNDQDNKDVSHSEDSQSKLDANTTDINKKDLDNDETPEADTTLFIKNLNFETTDASLKEHFECCGKVYYASVARKKDRNDPTKNLSMGYGFVRFVHKSDVDKALKTLQQSTLDGKSLELKRSERTLINDVPSTRKVAKKTKQTGTKILVRNVPFQATLKEIQELFKAFGEIKALRLPKKMTVGSDNAHRGFAFVDFVLANDAKIAFEALSQSTHLYGRRLVLEWASTEEGVDDIRKRTASHFYTTEEIKSKKSVFNIE